MMQIETTYCIIDEIVKIIMPKKEAGRKPKLSVSETITILIEGQKRGYSMDKQLYELIKYGSLKHCFKVPSYSQFNRSIRASRKYLESVIEQLTKISAGARELYIIDSTALPINKFNGPVAKWGLHSAQISKNMHGWYQGYKLHLVTNDQLQIVSVLVTPANVHDVTTLENVSFINKFKGILVADKGYIARDSVRKKLLNHGIKLIAKQRQDMDPYLNQHYASLLSQRRKIERIFAYFKKSLSGLRRHARTEDGFLAYPLAAVITYIFRFSNENSLMTAFC